MLTQSRGWRPDAWCGMRILDGRIYQLDGTTVRVVNFGDHSTCLDYIDISVGCCEIAKIW